MASERIPVKLTPLPNGKFRFEVSNKWGVLGASLPDDVDAMTAPGCLHLTVTPPRRKLAAAKWFLSQLNKCVRHESAALMFLEAFLSELRSTTFSLQALFHSNPGFAEWYEKQRESMREDEKLRWVVEARNMAQKVGLGFVEWGLHFAVRFPQEEAPFAEFVTPILEVEGLSQPVTLTDLELMLATIDNLVEEAHRLFLGEVAPRKNQIVMETIRQKEDGTWEHFNVGGPGG